MGLGGPPQLCSMARDPSCRETTQESRGVDPGGPCHPAVQPLHGETGTQRAGPPGTWVRSTRFSAGAGSVSALLCSGVGRGLPCLPRAAEAPHTDARSASPGNGRRHCAPSFSRKESGAASSGDWESLSLCVTGFPFPDGTLTPQGRGEGPHLPWAPPASRLWTRPRPSQVSAGRWAQGLPRTHACLCSCRPSLS